ncbi:hypothetical protein CHS0354_008885 [Potamilus streckersoni]|uniref:Uncharacterized protein n=1 Tax=Potamilus streckersoni TaxID=2493646 RepID=A0AAE0WA98_9BIVA|nr:hypothetical protein CHS0354_008885 [Potamilus streckersoni]
MEGQDQLERLVNAGDVLFMEIPMFSPLAPAKHHHHKACGTGQRPPHPQLTQRRLRHGPHPRGQQGANNTQESSPRQEEGVRILKIRCDNKG